MTHEKLENWGFHVKRRVCRLVVSHFISICANGGLKVDTLRHRQSAGNYIITSRIVLDLKENKNKESDLQLRKSTQGLHFFHFRFSVCSKFVKSNTLITRGNHMTCWRYYRQGNYSHE